MGASPDDEQVQQTRLQRALRWATDRPLRQVVLGIGMVALLLTAPFGGLNAAPKSTTIVEHTPSQEFTAGPLSVKITRAVTDSDPSTAFGPAKGGAYVMVFATVRSTDPDMVDPSVLRGVIRITGMTNLLVRLTDAPLTGPDGKPNPAYAPVAADRASATVYNGPDSTPLGSIGNGLTYQAVYVFQTADTNVPDEITLQTYDFTWRKSNLSQVEQWLDPTATGIQRVAVVKRDAKAHQQREGN